ncbi:MAG: polysaccharide deacetylase family protein [Christensenellales bacterium]
MAAIVAVCGSGAYKVAAGKTTRKLPVYCVDRQDKVVALSFDASWGADKTEAILDTLTRYDVKANFFRGLLGGKVFGYAQKLVDSGRMEIGTHSATHPHMSKLSKAEIGKELDESIATIEKITERSRFYSALRTAITTTRLLRRRKRGTLYDTVGRRFARLEGLSAGAIAARVLNGVKTAV